MACRHVLQLLEGLKGCFDARKASLLQQTFLPAIDEAIAAITQEDVWLSLDKADVKAVPTLSLTILNIGSGERPGTVLLVGRKVS